MVWIQKQHNHDALCSTACKNEGSFILLHGPWMDLQGLL